MSGRPLRRSWGWHRLADHVAQTLVERSAVGPGDIVLDLGAGDGVITHRLAATGARVIAFELHPDRAELLRRTCTGSNVKVVRADVRDLRLPTRPFGVVANPPFDGISAILVRLTSPGSRLERADLVVPRSVASVWRRRLDRPEGRWAVSTVTPLPRSAFRPRPRIDTCIITIVRRSPLRARRPRR
ncbi:MAG: rRNA adenine N-6-methyltransferase family protein [Ilumatobacteraceae bacterium]|nr:rRNA adenine N-6-methyltransferase family protein [Ilumatobacteraceae bacterium]